MSKRSRKNSGGAEEKSDGVFLQEGESLVMVARESRWLRLPRYLITLGLYGFWRKRKTAAVTDKRLLLGKGIFRRDEHSYPMKRVYNASFARKGLASYSEVAVETREGRRIFKMGPFSSRVARRITSEIQSRT